MYRIPGFALRDHKVTVPLDWNESETKMIEVLVREVVAPDRAGDDLPLLLSCRGDLAARRRARTAGRAGLTWRSDDFALSCSTSGEQGDLRRCKVGG